MKFPTIKSLVSAALFAALTTMLVPTAAFAVSTIIAEPYNPTTNAL
jgi:hypothetical protein